MLEFSTSPGVMRGSVDDDNDSVMSSASEAVVGGNNQFRRRNSRFDSEGGPEKATPAEQVAEMFEKANSYPRVQVGTTINRCFTFNNTSDLSHAMWDNASDGLCPNKDEHLQPFARLTPTMASVGVNWRIVHSDFVNCDSVFMHNTGPCLTFVRRCDMPTMPTEFKQLAHLVNCINTLPDYSDCILPTPRSRLRWNEHHSKIEGVSMSQMPYNRILRQQGGVTRKRRKLFNGYEISSIDELAVETTVTDSEQFVDMDYVARLFVSIIPVEYVVCTNDVEETFRATFWVGTVVPLPGVNLLRCFEKLGKPVDSRVSEMQDAAKERADLWESLLASEASDSFGLGSSVLDGIVNIATPNNYGMRTHPYLVANPLATVRKILNALPNRSQGVRIYGLPNIDTLSNFTKVDNMLVENQKLCDRWGKEFDTITTLVRSLRHSLRKFIPAVNLPPIPGFAVHESLDLDGQVFEYTYFTYLCRPPHVLLWQMAERTMHDQRLHDLLTGDLPVLTHALLMAWIFESNPWIFLTEVYDAKSESLIKKRSKEMTSNPVREFLREGEFRLYWNAHMSSGYKATGVLEDTLTAVDVARILQDEEPENMYASSQQSAAAGAGNNANDADEESEDDEAESSNASVSSPESETSIDSEQQEAEFAAMDARSDARRSKTKKASRYVDDAAQEGADEDDDDDDDDGEDEGDVFDDDEHAQDRRPGVWNSNEQDEDDDEHHIATDFAPPRSMQTQDVDDDHINSSSVASQPVVADDDESFKALLALAAELEKFQVRTVLFLRSLWRLHCAKVRENAYYSTTVTGWHEVIDAHPDLCKRMRGFVSLYRSSVKSPQGAVVMDAAISATAAGCMAHEGGVLAMNEFSYMNAANLTAFREMCTGEVGHYLGSETKTWSNFFMPMQIAVGYGNFYIQTAKDHTRAAYVVKQNSSGMDAVLMPTFALKRTLFRVNMHTLDEKSQDIVEYSRFTPAAYENLGRVKFSGGKLKDKPKPVDNGRLFGMTEQRFSNGDAMQRIVSATPRHNATTARRNVVRTTDLNSKGIREDIESVRIEAPKFLIGSTNVPAERADQGEVWLTLRSAFVFMAPGGPCLNEISTVETNEVANIVCDKSTKDLRAPTDEEQTRLSPGMCLSSIVASSIASMHRFGFFPIEISDMVTDLYEYYIKMFRTFFLWTIAPEVRASFKRIQGGWKTRGVADSLLYRVIGRFSREGEGTHREPAVDDAIASTCMSLSYNAHPVFLVPTQIHQNIRGMVDSGALLAARIFALTLRIPIVPFDWLVSVLTEQRPVNLQSDSRARLIHEWLKSRVVSKCFLPHDTESDVNLRTNVRPYVSTPGRDDGSVEGEETLVRFPLTGQDKKGLLPLARKIMKSTYAAAAMEALGVPENEHLYRYAIESFCALQVRMPNFFHGLNVYDVARIFQLFQVPNCPQFFVDNATRLSRGKAWDLGKSAQVGRSEEARTFVFGVHVTAVLVVTSLLLSNSEGNFCPNASSNAAANMMGTLTRFVAATSLPGDGKTVHIKNFKYSDPDPCGTHMRINDPQVPLREYFLRPMHDMEMHARGRVGLLPGRFKNFAYEDTVHMHALISWMKLFRVPVQNFAQIPARALRMEYEPVLGFAYPIVRAGVESLQLSRSGTECLGSLHIGADGLTATVYVALARRDEHGKLQLNGEVAQETIKLCDVETYLTRRGFLMYAAVHRRNALVELDGRYGVIVPFHNDGSVVIGNGATFFFHPTDFCYKVRWFTSTGSPTQTTDEIVFYPDLDNMLKPLGGVVYVRSNAPGLKNAFPELAGGTLENEFDVVRAALFYENKMVCEAGCDEIFVNILCQKVGLGMQSRHCRVVSILPSDLIHDGKVTSGSLRVSDRLWIPRAGHVGASF